MNEQSEKYFNDYIEEVNGLGPKDRTVPAGFYQKCSEEALGLEPVHFKKRDRLEAHYVVDNYRLVIKAYNDDPEVYGSIFEDGRHGKARFACVGSNVSMVYKRLIWFKRETEKHRVKGGSNG